MQFHTRARNTYTYMYTYIYLSCKCESTCAVYVQLVNLSNAHLSDSNVHLISSRAINAQSVSLASERTMSFVFMCELTITNYTITLGWRTRTYTNTSTHINTQTHTHTQAHTYRHAHAHVKAAVCIWFSHPSIVTICIHTSFVLKLTEILASYLSIFFCHLFIGSVIGRCQNRKKLAIIFKNL